MALTLAVLISPLSPASANAPSRVVADVDIVLAPGEDGTVRNSVPTQKIPANPDVFLLADTTSSMGAPIAAVRRNAAALLRPVRAVQPSVRFGVAEYRDTGADPVSFRVNQPLTANPSRVLTGIREWVATGGGDVPEDGYNALCRLATSDGRFRDGESRTIVWIGDAPSHNPSNGHTGNQVVRVLRANGIRVIAMDVGGLNAFGQASAVARLTGGALLGQVPPAALGRTILSGIDPVSVVVKPVVNRCDPELSVRISPGRQRVKSGAAARFRQRIQVASGAEAGDYRCTVSYRAGGRPTGQTDTLTVRVRGIAIDDVTVTEGTGKGRPQGTRTARFTVSLTGPSSAPVSVAYRTVAGSASIPADLTPHSGRILFPPGVTEQTLPIWIRPDKLDEPKEMFTLNLSRPKGAGIADAVGIGTIVDDD